MLDSNAWMGRLMSGDEINKLQKIGADIAEHEFALNQKRMERAKRIDAAVSELTGAALKVSYHSGAPKYLIDARNALIESLKE